MMKVAAWIVLGILFIGGIVAGNAFKVSGTLRPVTTEAFNTPLMFGIWGTGLLAFCLLLAIYIITQHLNLMNGQLFELREALHKGKAKE